MAYGDVSETFTGPPEAVWIGVNRFFTQHFPAMSLLSKIILTVDVEELIRDVQRILKVTPDGEIYLTLDRRLFTDREAIMLYLIGAFLTYKLGYRERGVLSLGELCSMVRKPRKLVSTRLSELCARRWAVKDEERNFMVTINGIKQFIDNVLPRIERRTEIAR